MRKFFGIIAMVTFAFAFVSCDGAKKAEEAAAKAKADSTRVADSVATITAKLTAERLAAEAKLKATADSVRVADSLAKAATVKKKK